jgi:hypothetical protein
MFEVLIQPPPPTIVRWVYDDPSGLPDLTTEAA